MIHKKKKGAALAMVLIVFAVLSILGSSILYISLSETKQVIHQEKRMKEYYAAYSGADAMASHIIAHPEDADEIIEKTALNPGTGTIEGADFKVKVSNGLSDDEIIIESTGIIKGVSPQKITLTLKKKPSNIFNNAIFADEELNIDQKVVVYGDVGTNASSVTIGSGGVYGDLLLGPDADETSFVNYKGKVNGEVTKQDTKTIIPKIDEDKFTEQYANIEKEESFTIEKGKKRYIEVDKIKLNGKSIKVNGGGQLHLLVTNSFELGGSGDIVCNDGSKVFIYYKGTKEVVLHGTPSAKGIVIFAPDAAITWKGGGNGKFFGSMIGKSFNGPNSKEPTITQDKELKIEDLLVTGGESYIRTKWGQ